MTERESFLLNRALNVLNHYAVQNGKLVFDDPESLIEFHEYLATHKGAPIHRMKPHMYIDESGNKVRYMKDELGDLLSEESVLVKSVHDGKEHYGVHYIDESVQEVKEPDEEGLAKAQSILDFAGIKAKAVPAKLAQESLNERANKLNAKVTKKPASKPVTKVTKKAATKPTKKPATKKPVGKETIYAGNDEVLKPKIDPTVKMFWDEFEPLFQWDLLPFKFLYNLYIRWFKVANTKSTLRVAGRSTFVGDIKELVKDDPKWTVPANSSGASKLVTVGDKMNKVEPLLTKYGIEKPLDTTVRGLQRVK